MTLSANSVRKDLKKLATKERAKVNAYFFKTGKGQYGFGDKFWGVSTPDTRKVAIKYIDLRFDEIKKLISDPVHEVRTVGFFILVERFRKAGEKTRNEIVDFYLSHTKYANNWDLVDMSAYKILGNYLIDKKRVVLYKLVKSDNLWERRISIIATYSFIRNNDFSDTLKISEMLLEDKHDLMHKAIGWMLREVGKKNLAAEEDFLKKHYRKMPRTALRYAIERFPESKKKFYMKKS